MFILDVLLVPVEFYQLLFVDRRWEGTGITVRQMNGWRAALRTRGNIHLVLARMMVFFEASSAGDMQTRGSLGLVEYVQTDGTGDLVYQRR